MNKAVKAALAGIAVVLTGPIGLLAIAVYYLRKQSEQQAQLTAQKQSTEINRDLINLNNRDFQ